VVEKDGEDEEGNNEDTEITEGPGDEARSDLKPCTTT
jgi:hypothetical protein